MIRYEAQILINGIILGNKNKKIHFVLRNGRFYNGVIVNSTDDEFITIIDNKLGHINILYKDILNIEPYKIKS
jgi:hypothetical protein